MLVLLAGWLLFGLVVFLVSHLIYSTLRYCTVLYCTVLYCTVLTYPTLSTGEQAAPLPTVSVSPPGDAVPVQGADQDSVQFVQVTHDYSHQLSTGI